MGHYLVYHECCVKAWKLYPVYVELRDELLTEIQYFNMKIVDRIPTPRR